MGQGFRKANQLSNCKLATGSAFHQLQLAVGKAGVVDSGVSITCSTGELFSRKFRFGANVGGESLVTQACK